MITSIMLLLIDVRWSGYACYLIRNPSAPDLLVLRASNSIVAYARILLRYALPTNNGSRAFHARMVQSLGVEDAMEKCVSGLWVVTEITTKNYILLEIMTIEVIYMVIRGYRKRQGDWSTCGDVSFIWFFTFIINFEVKLSYNSSGDCTLNILILFLERDACS